MNIPFPQGITGIDAIPKAKEYLLNIFITKDGAVRTPGVDGFSTGSGACRGAVTWRDGSAYMVSGQSLIRVNRNGSVDDLGTIKGDADCVFSEGQVNLVVIVKGGKGYYYNSFNGLTEITDPDFIPSVSVDFIDGRHVFIPFDGEPAFYSGVDDPASIGALSFFDAEELPDKNRAVINIKNQLHILGDKSIEIFRTNIDPDVVFTRRQGARIDIGYIGGLVRFGEGFAFLGRKRDQSYRFYVVSGGQYSPISTTAIDEILNKYTAEKLEACDALRFEWLGYEALVFKLDEHTFYFINGLWGYVSSELNNSPKGRWRAKGICHAYGSYIVGDETTRDIGKLADVPTEYGNDVEFEVQTFIRDKKNSFLDIRRIELNCLTGQKDESISLAVSSDGFTYGDFVSRRLGSIGDYQKQVAWQPIGTFENFCGLRLRSTADVKFGLEAIEAL